MWISVELGRKAEEKPWKNLNWAERKAIAEKIFRSPRGKEFFSSLYIFTYVNLQDFIETRLHLKQCWNISLTTTLLLQKHITPCNFRGSLRKFLKYLSSNFMNFVIFSSCRSTNTKSKNNCKALVWLCSLLLVWLLLASNSKELGLMKSLSKLEWLHNTTHYTEVKIFHH